MATPKLPQPFSEQIELAVLGGLMSSNDAFDQIAEILKPDSFYIRKNQIIFEAISELSHRNESHDVISVLEHIKAIDQKHKKSKFKEEPREKQIGGVDYLYDIVSQYDTYSNIKSHAQILARYRTLRKLIEVGTKINELGLIPGEQDTEELINEAEHLVFEIGQENFDASHIESSATLASQVKDSYNKAKELKGYPGVLTGFDELDDLLLGLQSGGLYVLAARPGVGKTSFALNIASTVAKQGKSVLIFSLEMTGEELMRRMVAGEAEVNSYNILQGKLSAAEYGKFNHAITDLQNLPIDADESAHLNPTELLSRSRRMFKRKKSGGSPLGLVIIDYIQLMNVPWVKDNRVREISEITRHLKILAKELQIPVLALSQLNREFDKQPSKGKPRPPRLSDLRDSGSIEQDADVVMFIERALAKDKEDGSSEEPAYSMAINHKSKSEPETDNTDPSQAFLHLAKNRHGATSKIELYFAEKFTKFKNKSERPLFTTDYVSSQKIGK